MDPMQWLVPKAKVSLKSLDTSRTFKTRTNDKGEFTFPKVPLGNYELLIRSSGFCGARQKVDATFGKDLKLSPIVVRACNIYTGS